MERKEQICTFRIKRKESQTFWVEERMIEHRKMTSSFAVYISYVCLSIILQNNKFVWPDSFCTSRQVHDGLLLTDPTILCLSFIKEHCRTEWWISCCSGSYFLLEISVWVSPSTGHMLSFMSVSIEGRKFRLILSKQRMFLIDILIEITDCAASTQLLFLINFQTNKISALLLCLVLVVTGIILENNFYIFHCLEVQSLEPVFMRVLTHLYLFRIKS